MRFKLYMDMAIALKSITENIIKPGRDLVHEISTEFLLENKLKATPHNDMKNPHHLPI